TVTAVVVHVSCDGNQESHGIAMRARAGLGGRHTAFFQFANPIPSLASGASVGLSIRGCPTALRNGSPEAQKLCKTIGNRSFPPAPVPYNRTSAQSQLRGFGGSAVPARGHHMAQADPPSKRTVALFTSHAGAYETVRHMLHA